MGRISFTDDTGRLCWFDPAAAKDTITEGSYWDGNNWRGACSRLQTSRAVLYLTSGSRWVENADARCEDNGHDDYLHFTDEEAQAWLIRSADAPRGGEQAQTALKKYFGDIPEESGPGRPEIGGTVNTRLGDLLPRVDAWAEMQGLKRAEAIRRLVTAGLDAEGARADPNPYPLMAYLDGYGHPARWIDGVPQVATKCGQTGIPDATDETLPQGETYPYCPKCDDANKKEARS